ncbi:hypothetical protein D3C81_1653860 [compost metagenome]
MAVVGIGTHHIPLGPRSLAQPACLVGTEAAAQFGGRDQGEGGGVVAQPIGRRIRPGLAGKAEMHDGLPGKQPMPFAPVDQHQLGSAGGACRFAHQRLMRVAALLQRLDEAAGEPQREPCQGHGDKGFAPGRPAQQPAFEQPRYQRGDGQHQARQRREDVQLALATAEAEKQQHQRHPAE